MYKVEFIETVKLYLILYIIIKRNYTGTVIKTTKKQLLKI